MPPTLNGSFQGTAQAFQASLSSTPLLVAAAILVVYIVLGMLYESYIHPITILSALAVGRVGALLALMAARHYDLSVIAIVGVILLIGIVKKNAIMMIDFALQAERIEGKSPLEAIHEACLLALPADHDDDLRGAVRRDADRVRRRRRIRAAPAARHRDRRRAACVAMADAVHDPVIYLYLDRLGRFLGGSTRPSRLAEAVGAGPGPRLADEPRGAAE